MQFDFELLLWFWASLGTSDLTQILNWIFLLSLLHSDHALSIYHWSSHCYTMYWVLIVRSVDWSSWAIAIVDCYSRAILVAGERITPWKSLLLKHTQNFFVWTVHWALTFGAFITLLKRLSVIVHCSSWAVVVVDRRKNFYWNESVRNRPSFVIDKFAPFLTIYSIIKYVSCM